MQKIIEEKIEISIEYILTQSNNFWEERKVNSFANKQIFITKNCRKPELILFQLFGNLGGTANNFEFDQTTDFFVIADLDFENIKLGISNLEISDLEMRLNKKGKHYKNLKVIKESFFIDYVADRLISCPDSSTENLLKQII